VRKGSIERVVTKRSRVCVGANELEPGDFVLTCVLDCPAKSAEGSIRAYYQAGSNVVYQAHSDRADAASTVQQPHTLFQMRG